MTKGPRRFDNTQKKRSIKTYDKTRPGNVGAKLGMPPFCKSRFGLKFGNHFLNDAKRQFANVQIAVSVVSYVLLNSPATRV